MTNPLGTISLSFYGAIRRTKYALQQFPPPNILGEQCPQRQALTRLEWRATEGKITVPYRFLNPDELMGLPGTWALFQLFEIIQLRAAWQLGEMPGLEEYDIREAFSAVAHPDMKSPYFPEGNVSPQARRLLFQTGQFKPKFDIAVYLEHHESENFANFKRASVDPFLIPLPENIWLNPETDVWEVRP